MGPAFHFFRTILFYSATNTVAFLSGLVLRFPLFQLVSAELLLCPPLKLRGGAVGHVALTKLKLRGKIALHLKKGWCGR